MLDLVRYTADVATAEANSSAPLVDVAATGGVTIQFTDDFLLTEDFLFAATSTAFTTARNYDNEGETIGATSTRNDEVSGEWDWFDEQTLDTSRVVSSPTARATA